MSSIETLKSLVTNKTNSVYDYEFLKALGEVPFKDWVFENPPLQCRLEYLEKYDNRIHASELNNVSGLDSFEKRHLINGTTQSFDEAYHRYAGKRLRIFRGEYAYHKRINPDYIFIEDEPLKSGDYIIVSFPFCSTGDKHILFDEILDKAYALDIPVEVDCAYFGTCWGQEMILNHPAIKAVSFSLTKSLGLGDIRSGVRYSNYPDDNFPIEQQNNYNHTILLAAKVGIHMMDRFSPDHIPLKFKDAQESACKDLGIIPSKCMHIALADETWGNEYLVDNKYYRVGIRQLVKDRFRKRV